MLELHLQEQGCITTAKDFMKMIYGISHEEAVPGWPKSKWDEKLANMHECTFLHYEVEEEFDNDKHVRLLFSHQARNTIKRGDGRKDFKEKMTQSVLEFLQSGKTEATKMHAERLMISNGVDMSSLGDLGEQWQTMVNNELSICKNKITLERMGTGMEVVFFVCRMKRQDVFSIKDSMLNWFTHIKEIEVSPAKCPQLQSCLTWPCLTFLLPHTHRSKGGWSLYRTPKASNFFTGAERRGTHIHMDAVPRPPKKYF